MRGLRRHRSDRACRRETNADSSWQNVPCPPVALAVAPRRAPGYSSRQSQRVRLASGPTPATTTMPILRVPAPEPVAVPRTQMLLPLLGSEASGAPPLHPRPLALPKAAYQSETAAEPTDFTMLLPQPRANITLPLALAISGQALAASVQASLASAPRPGTKTAQDCGGSPGLLVALLVGEIMSFTRCAAGGPRING